MTDMQYVEDLPENLLVPHYLMSCYLYYERDTPVLSDEAFDRLCVRLLECFDEVGHYHKHLVSKEHLRCQTGYDLKYTTRTKCAAVQWATEGPLALMEKK